MSFSSAPLFNQDDIGQAAPNRLGGVVEDQNLQTAFAFGYDFPHHDKSIWDCCHVFIG